jgi:multiple sugar transport system ATP-binding protein
VAVLGDGLLQQCDTPRALYERPANTFVAGFIGSPAMNLCRCDVADNGSVSLGGVTVSLPNGARAEARKDVTVGLRPEALELAEDGIAADVDVVEEIGADAYVFASATLAGEPIKLVARVDAKGAPERGAHVKLRPRAGEAHLFDTASGARL